MFLLAVEVRFLACSHCVTCAEKPDLGNYRHQRMEPIGDQFSHPTWVLPACQAE